MFGKLHKLFVGLMAIAVLVMTVNVAPAMAQLKAGAAGNQNPPIAFNDWTQVQSSNLGQITKLTVHHGWLVDGIQATYNTTSLPAHGGMGGVSSEATFTATDPLVEVSGYYGDFAYGNGLFILQLTLKSKSGKVFGPFGTMQGSSNTKPFSYSTCDDQAVRAFWGGIDSGSGKYVTTLGIYATRAS